MESAHAHDNFLLGADLMHPPRRLIHEVHSRHDWGVAAGVRDQLLHGRVVQHTQVRPMGSLLVVAIITRAPQELRVQCGSSLLDASTVARVVVVHDRDLQRLAGSMDEADAGRGHVSLETELERTVAVGAWIPRLEALVKAVGLIWRIEMRSLGCRSVMAGLMRRWCFATLTNSG